MVNLSAGQRLLWTLMCVLVILNIKSAGGAGLIILDSAVAKGAVCLDGSPPAYQFEEGFGDGVKNWLVYMEGGGWCNSVEDCRARASMKFGSSKHMSSLDDNFSGILSHERELNPNFYNWNRAIVRYCDGSSFTGDAKEENPATNLYFRGARIFDVVMEELQVKGMKHASNALLTGVSAGGLTSILNCDKFQALFPTLTRVKCVSDAGYFAHVKDLSGEYKFEGYFDQVTTLHESAKNLPPACISKMRPGLCFYPQFAIPHIQTPIFVINTAYDTFQIQNILASPQADLQGSFAECKMNLNLCSADQLKRLEDFRSDFLVALAATGHSTSAGWFIINCFSHGLSVYQDRWLGNPSWEINNKAAAEVVGDWFYDKSKIQMIDRENVLPHSCAG